MLTGISVREAKIKRCAVMKKKTHEMNWELYLERCAIIPVRRKGIENDGPAFLGVMSFVRETARLSATPRRARCMTCPAVSWYCVEDGHLSIGEECNMIARGSCSVHCNLFYGFPLQGSLPDICRACSVDPRIHIPYDVRQMSRESYSVVISST